MTDSILPAEGEHLANGWEVDLADDDTLVRQAVHVHASWLVEVAQSTGRPWLREARWAGAWIGDRGALTNLVILLQPPEDPASIINDVSAMFPAQVPYALISPWPVDLGPHGLALLGHPPLMVRFPDGSLPPPHPDVDVREVGDAEELAVAERVLVEGYPMPDLEPLKAGDLLGPEILEGPTRVWLGYVDGQPVAIAAAHPSAGVTLVEYVATLAAARGRGAGAAVTWAATLANADNPAVLVASDDGRPVYERMGYRAIERWTAWLRPPA